MLKDSRLLKNTVIFILKNLSKKSTASINKTMKLHLLNIFINKAKECVNKFDFYLHAVARMLMYVCWFNVSANRKIAITTKSCQKHQAIKVNSSQSWFFL